eukprot:1767-Heterococcus_DN1.PRE.3
MLTAHITTTATVLPASAVTSVDVHSIQHMGEGQPSPLVYKLVPQAHSSVCAAVPSDCQHYTAFFVAQCSSCVCLRSMFVVAIAIALAAVCAVVVLVSASVSSGYTTAAYTLANNVFYSTQWRVSINCTLGNSSCERLLVQQCLHWCACATSAHHNTDTTTVCTLCTWCHSPHKHTTLQLAVSARGPAVPSTAAAHHQDTYDLHCVIPAAVGHTAGCTD